MSNLESKEQLQSSFKKALPIFLGVLFLLIGLSILVFTYSSYLKALYRYEINDKVVELPIELTQDSSSVTQNINDNTEKVFVDSNFGLYIPKISANASVIQNVDPFREEMYLSALEKGVAHAKGSALPNQSGNVFLFAHSAVNFYEQRQYNIYFYLLNKLEKGDILYLTYQGEVYYYKVEKVSFVKPNDVQYLGNYENYDTLTLMSCYPPGVNWQRIIVTAGRASSDE